MTWGDGGTSTAGLTIAGSGGTYTVSGTHQYTETGTYNFTITVLDDGGSTATIHGMANVGEAQLTNPGGVTITPQATIPFGPITVATFVDPGDTTITPDADYQANITWGDLGSTNTATFVNVGGAGTDVWAVQASHTYASSGPYSITVTITDGVYPTGSGTPNTVVAHSTANVLAAPVYTLTGLPTNPATDTSQEGFVSSTVVLATFSDNDPYANSALNPSGANAPTYSGQINWGDGGIGYPSPDVQGFTSATPPWAGSVSVIQAPGKPGTYEVIGSHLYKTAGVYPVTVNIMSTAATPVTVSNVGFKVYDVPLVASKTPVSLTIAGPGTTWNGSSHVGGTIYEDNPTGTETVATFTDTNPWATISNPTGLLWDDQLGRRHGQPTFYPCQRELGVWLDISSYRRAHLS